ncbi:hypothetical protein BJF80_12520 [Serinicoccus sp. CUA-874]|uniref:lytic transglycosylase n=1 Tax=Serinicoccus sp. CUA-874 TaxID=1517939 RepID=UPI00095CB6AB|nr:LysM peptidoglycan-binding domain-containing protein [Serinicoccus sp. CUA-874]OLT14784.1 hypothetical protein BJF80_12520 [Serinicoccus sp. CUA-874]
MSPLFAALPPGDLPTHAYVAPTGVHATAPLAVLPATRETTHTVTAGDTVYDIAARYDVSPRALVRANSLPDGGRWIMPGARLRIPVGGDTDVAPAASAPAPSSGSEKGGSASSSGASSGGTVTVRGGDTLTDIAARHGVSVADIARANDLQDTRLIYPGQELRLGGAAPEADRSRPEPLDRPYDETTIGDHRAGEAVPDTFLHYRYGDGIARSAAANRDYLAGTEVPSRAAVRDLIVRTSERHGVDPTLMLALSYQESGWNHRAVSPANAIGAMQVIPSSGQWASGLVGRELNLLDPEDNVTAGVVIMRTLLRSADTTDEAIGGYYQGLASVRQHGLFADTRQYVRNITYVQTTL